MELDKRQWYVRWFFWSLMIWDEFADHGDSSWYYEKYGTNLCHFLRVMLVWCPLVLLLNAAVYSSAIAALTILPIYLWGGVGYAWIVGTIAFVVGVILVVKYLLRRLKEWEDQRTFSHPVEEKSETPKIEAAAVPSGPSFWQILRQYIVAAKQKVCPIITFNNQTQGAAS